MLVSASAWALAQLSKVLVVLIRDRRLNLRLIVESGGMPSSHTATVWALVAAVAMTEGLDSVFFAVSVILAMVVTYDAAGVRQAVSRQSIVLDRIIEELVDKRPRSELERNILELIGHTPFQVIAGAMLGIFVAWLWIAVINF